MSIIRTVAVAGASGTVGKPVVQGLFAAGFTVTALSRSDSKSTFPSGVKVANVDYNSVGDLTSALKDHDALVCTLSAAVGLEQQYNLVEAAFAAGVKRILPSEFGCDQSKPPASQLPVFADKIKVRDRIVEKTQASDTTSYTFVFNNVFLDWGIDFKFLIDLQSKKIDIFDGGDHPFTSTPLDFVGKGVVSVLQHPKETENRFIRLQGALTTQNQFLAIAQRVVGKEGWQVNHNDSAEEEKKAYAKLKENSGDVYGWLVPMLKRAIYAEGWGGSFEGKNDNEMLGLKQMSEGEVEELIRSKV